MIERLLFIMFIAMVLCLGFIVGSVARSIEVEKTTFDILKQCTKIDAKQWICE